MKAAGLGIRTALVTAVVGAALPLATGSASAEHGGGIAEIVMPIGPDGATYKAPQGEDDGEWLGPSALAISPDGVVWVADVYADRVLRYLPDGTRLAPVDVAALGVESAIDVASTATTCSCWTCTRGSPATGCGA